VHLYQRLLCDRECRLQRIKLSCLQADYRQYWYDRRRGVPAMPAKVFYKWHAGQPEPPLWKEWGAA